MEWPNLDYQTMVIEISSFIATASRNIWSNDGFIVTMTLLFTSKGCLSCLLHSKLLGSSLIPGNINLFEFVAK